ncbi:MAG: sigma 54-interacting transcriptional regulator [Lentisphaeria bacterium]|nr:sigma 54-interacting transcriptional regulator [Lentisphaeria bacterium]
MRVLFSWIGFKDLNYIADNLDDQKFKNAVEREKGTRDDVSSSSTYSPIYSAIEYCEKDNRRIDKLVVFCDLDCQEIQHGVKTFFQKKSKIRVAEVEIAEVQVASQEAAHDYSVVVRAAEKWKEIKPSYVSGIEPYFNLSSGTTQMKAFLTIVGQACYREAAKFIELTANENKGPQVQELPSFDITSYIVNERISSVDLTDFDPIIGKTEGIMRAKIRAAKAAATDCNVLIYGETGTGKELFAQAIHDASERAKKGKKLHSVNCATLSGNLLVSELFGHVKGAFTGAITDKRGLVKIADGGTLFLDEVYACEKEVQQQLLRALQPGRQDKMTTRKYTPLGSGKDEQSDVRIIAATNQSLDGDDFRNDLLNRLSTLTITLPPLRERVEDIPLIIDNLMKSIKKDLGNGYDNKYLCDSAITFLKSRYWKGNVRELKNALYHAVVFGENGDRITEDDFEDLHLPARDSNQISIINQDAIDLSKPIDVIKVIDKAKAELQKKYVEKAMCLSGNKKGKAAKLLRTSPQTLDNWKAAWEKLENE